MDGKQEKTTGPGERPRPGEGTRATSREIPQAYLERLWKRGKELLGVEVPTLKLEDFWIGGLRQAAVG